MPPEFELTSSLATGLLVPIPTFPPFVTMKFVIVDEPIAKLGQEMPFGFTESCAHGVVVPTPNLLFVLSQTKVSSYERLPAAVQKAARLAAPEPVREEPLETQVPLMA